MKKIEENSEKNRKTDTLPESANGYAIRKNTFLIVVVGLLIAVQFILERLVPVIETPVTRVSFTFVGRAVTGVCVEPVYGMIAGIAADLLGCFYKGYAINPIITFAAAFRGLAFGILLYKKVNIFRITLAAFLDQFVAGLVITTYGLFTYGGVPYSKETIIARLIQCSVIFVLEEVFLIATRKNLLAQIRKYMSVLYRTDRI